MKIPFFKNSKAQKKEELPKPLQRVLVPDGQLLHEGKRKFLAAFDASSFAHDSKAQSSPFAWGIKFGIGVLAVMAIVAGTSAYADTTNVAADSPLYPLKRLGETVQLALTPSQEKAQLQATFATRRAAEIDELQKTHPSSTLIAALAKDLNDDVSSSLNMASDTKLQAKPLTDFCSTFLGRLGIALAMHPELLARFNAKCGSDVASTTFTSSTINIQLKLNSSSILLFDARHVRRKVASSSVSSTVQSSL
jgi:hypothetical protein